MSAHPVFHNFPQQRGRYRAWTPEPPPPEPSTTTTPVSVVPDTEFTDDVVVPETTARLQDLVQEMDPPDPDPEVEGALSSGLHRWKVFTRRGDEAQAGEDRFSHFRSPVFQQSVTLTAKMWPEDSEGSDSSAGGWASWRVSGEHLPLVVGGVAGGALIVMLIVAAVVWRLCVLRRDKQYRVRMGESVPEARPVQPVMPSESAVFASPVSGRWAYQSRLLGSGGSESPRGSSTPPAGLRSPSLGPLGGSPLATPHHPTPHATPPPQAWVYGDTIIAEARSASASASPAVHRSISLQLAQQSPGRRYPAGCGRASGGRPLSAVSSMGSYSAGCSPATARHSASLLPPPPPEFLLPDICEFNPGASSGSTQYASSSVLDEGAEGDSLDGDSPGALQQQEALRTRSLPSSVRNKQRPLGCEEDLDQLYAKVNFSKKRKNRMRHDEAAIIAISKSRSQFLDKMAAEQDEDALVDNEAVIVYNERTAL